MQNVFKKLIRHDLGKTNYYRFVDNYKNKIIQENIKSKEFDLKIIYDDIYNILKNEKYESLLQKQKNITDTIFVAVRINKTYNIALLFYLITSIFLISMNLIYFVTIISLILMSICFLYKTCEFIINKFCYIDVHIVVVYKEVLDTLISEYKN